MTGLSDSSWNPESRRLGNRRSAPARFSGSSPFRRFLRPARAGVLAGAGALLAAWTVSAAEPVAVRTLQDLREAVQSRQRAPGDVEVEAVVRAADIARGLLALEDATDVVVCALDLGGREVYPGERIRLVARHGELIRRRWSVALGAAPVVDNAGVHGVSEASGSVHLTAGLHPIRLYYFNVANPALLEVSYAGPGVARQLIPGRVLFQRRDAAGGERENGLLYFCYDDTPATLDRVHNQPPTHSGVVTNFDISARQPEIDVAMQFRGFIEIAEPGEYTFTVRSDDGAELYVGEFKPVITGLGSAPAPPPAPPPAPSLPPPAERGKWRTVEGAVAFAGKNRDGLEIVLQERDGATHLWLASDEGLPPDLLPGARVLATGVYHRVMGTGDGEPAGMLTVVGAGNFRILDVAAELWGEHSKTSLASALRLAGAEGVIARVPGEVRGLRPDGEFQLADGAAEISVRPVNAGGWTNGLAVEVLGVVRQTPSGPRMDPAFGRPRAPLAPEPPLLTTAAQVQQLSASDAERQHPVVVRGVITCLVEWGGAVVQDGTRGVFFSFEPAYRDGLVPGDYAEIRGVTAAGDFAPVIEARSIRVLGPGRMPEPARPSWSQLMSGSLDSQYAEVRGLVTEAAGNRVTLLTEGGRLRVTLHDTGVAVVRRLVNTLVRIRGCLLAEWDAETRQVRVGEIRFRNPTIEIDRLPMTDPFAGPEKTISDLLLFDLHASGFERVRISGQIVHVRSGEYFLTREGLGLRFRLAAESGLKPGDLAEVAGIPELGGPSLRLHEAVARKTGTAPLPVAASWNVVEQAATMPDATRVEGEARLIGLHRAGPEWVLELQAGLRAFRARLDTTDNLAAQLPPGSRLLVTGVYAALGGGREGDPAGFELLLNSPADLRLLERPSWWTLRRLLFIVASLVVVLAMAAIWINQLHRRVALRTGQLEREHARRERAERERALEQERARIARDLHDDLGSSLTEIRVLASGGLRQAGADIRAPAHFQAIAEKARHLVGALDVIVWAVDPEANSLQSLADYLGSYAEEYLTPANIACRFKIPAALPAVMLDGQARHDVFLAVKETLHNIVRHSRATEVEFHLDPGGDSVRIVIADNGRGFDPSAAGRHGLRNIAERLARMGGQCLVESRPGAGARVAIHIPVSRHWPGAPAEAGARA